MLKFRKRDKNTAIQQETSFTPTGLQIIKNQAKILTDVVLRSLLLVKDDELTEGFQFKVHEGTETGVRTVEGNKPIHKRSWQFSPQFALLTFAFLLY